MILTCPSCGTQYVVKDGAIPPEGRQVRCASCKHSWHQDPEGTVAAIASEEPPRPDVDEPIRDEPESIAEATLIEPRSGPEAEERAYEEAAAADYAAGAESGGSMSSGPGFTDVERESDLQATSPAAAPSVEDRAAVADDPGVTPGWSEPSPSDDFTPFPVYEEEPPRKSSPLLKLLVLLIVIAAIAAAFWFLAPPQWKAMLGLADTASPLALVTTHMDRQKLESGNELLTVTGRVINPTATDQAVPPLQAQLKSRAGKIVYRWTIAPPARTLPPGASASFNSAEVNVPPGGDELTISLGAPKA